MKRFQFPVEKVRAWRHEQAEWEELKMQQLHAELHGLAAQKRELESEASRSEEALKQGSSIDSQDLVRLDEFKQYVRARGITLDAQASQCESKIGQQRQALIEARRKAELLDRLKAKALSEWRSAYDSEHETLSTELFLAKRRRNINE